MQAQAVRGAPPNVGGGALQVLGAEERERDDKVDVRALDDALDSRMWPTCEVDG